MRELFQPVGDKAQWEVIYEFICRRRPTIGEVISYEEFEGACGFDIRKCRQAFYKAANLWCEENHRVFVPVTGTGYRVGGGTEHETIARKHHRKSRRSLGKGLKVIRNTDLEQLSPKDRERFQRIELEMRRQSDVIKRLDLRQTKMEDALNAGKKVQEQTLAEQAETRRRVDQLAEALRRHGIEPDDPT